MKSLITTCILLMSCSVVLSQQGNSISYSRDIGHNCGTHFEFEYDSISGTLIRQNITFLSFSGEMDSLGEICSNGFAIYSADQNGMSYTPSLKNEWFPNGQPKLILRYFDKSQLKIVYEEYNDSGKLISEQFYYHLPNERFFFKPCGTWWKFDEKGRKIKYAAPLFITE